MGSTQPRAESRPVPACERAADDRLASWNLDIPLFLEPLPAREPASAGFLVRGPGWETSLGDAEATYRFGGAPMRMRFLGADPAARIEGTGRLRGRSSIYLGNDPALWRPNLPHYAHAETRGLHRGVDLRWSTERGTLEWALRFAPGTARATVALAFDGADEVLVDGGGRLVRRNASGRVRQSRPVAWQERDGARIGVEAEWEIRAAGGAAIALGPSDPSLPLFVDPEHEFTTYIGAPNNAWRGNAATVGPDGFPVVAGEMGSDSFIARFAGDGTVDFIVYYGGSGNDQCMGMTVLGDGSIVTTGWTGSPNFPAYRALQETSGGQRDAFVLKTTPEGIYIDWATYLGGDGDDYGSAVVAGADGTVYLTGYTRSADFPVKSALQGSFAGETDAFVVALEPDGRPLRFATFLGGTAHDSGQAIAIAPDGSVFITGDTHSTDFPMESPYQDQFAGDPNLGTDVFVASLTPTGDALRYSTYLGGIDRDEARGIAVDGSGAAFVVGHTVSTDFPTQSPIQASSGGGSDAFVAKFSPEGSALAWSTYLGGVSSEEANAVTLDGPGNVWVTGSTNSENFPLAGTPLQSSLAGGTDAFVTAILPTGTSLRSSTYLGGNGGDEGNGIGASSYGLAVTGTTSSTNFPVKFAFQSSPQGSLDAFVRFLRLGPKRPTLSGSLPFGKSYLLQWEPSGTDHNSWRVERRTGFGPWQLLLTAPSSTTTYLDTTLEYSTRYVYRVQALGSEGDSLFSNEASVVTPPSPPAIPTDVAVAILGSTSVSITWIDNAVNEDLYRVQRKPLGGEFAQSSLLGAGATAATETGLLPGQTYTWRVQAANGGGGGTSGEVEATLPASLAVALAKGASKDSAKPGKDTLSVSGTWSFLESAADAVYNPVFEGLELRLGPEGTAPLVVVPPGSTAWKYKGSKITWKSAKGALPKAVVVFDTLTGTFRVKVSKFDYPSPPESPFLLWLASGNDGGPSEEPWTLKKPGVLKYP